MLQEFAKCLDEASAAKLQTMQRQNYGLTLAQFKTELRSMFCADAQSQYRKSWEAVPLVLTGAHNDRLDLQNWRQFVEAYRLRRGEVQGTTPDEEWKLIMKRLPEFWQRKIVEERCRQKEKNPWVRLTTKTGLGAEWLAAATELRLQGAPDWEGCPGGIIVHTTNDDDRRELLRLNQALVEGHVVQASAHEFEMGADKIFAFVSKKLQVEEDLQATRDNLGMSDARGKRPAASAAQVQFSGPVGYESPRPRKVYDDSKDRAPNSGAINERGCNQCRLAGREFVHPFRECEMFKKACETLKKRWLASPCRVCARAGRPADHDYRACNENLRSRRDGKKPDSRPAGAPTQQGSQ